VVGDLLHDYFLFVADNVVEGLSGGCFEDGVYIDHVDHVVEFLSFIWGEWLPVAWPIHCTVKGDGPQGPDESYGFFDFGTV